MTGPSPLHPRLRRLLAVVAHRSSERRPSADSARPRVEFAGHGDGEAREAFVEQVSRVGTLAEVSVLLDDGSDATARLDVSDLDWLDVRAGDIVRVRDSYCAALSG